MSALPGSQQMRSQRLLLGIVAGVVLLGIFAVALAWHQAKRVLKDAEGGWAAVALIFTALSYPYSVWSKNLIYGES